MSSMLTVKFRRDLRANWSRFALMTVAIAVSLTVCGAVLYAWSAVGRETREAYLGTEPASATILLEDSVSAPRMEDIAAAAGEREGILTATGRTQLESQIEVNGEPRDVPLQVFAATPNDAMEIARFDVGQGSWPPSRGEILIGQDSLGLLDVAVGDTVTVRRPDGSRVDLQVAGTVYDPSLAPSGQEQRGHAYVSTTVLGGAAEPVLDQLKIQVAAAGKSIPSNDRSDIVAEATKTGDWLKRTYGLAVQEIQVPEPEAHPHQFQADVLLLSLLGGGVAALLLSTILVANMLNTLFTQQIPHIGIMKAVGARSGRIGGMYVAMTLVVAASATLIALVPGIWLGRLLGAQILSMLAIEPVSLAPIGWTYPIVIGVGLLLPALMTLVPLLKASRITVRAAIDHHGGSANAGAVTRVLARLSRTRRVDRTLVLALRNTVRRPVRFLLSVGLLASAGTVFVAGMSLGDGMSAVAEEQQDLRVWDVDVQLATPATVDEAREAVRQVPQVTAVDGLNVTTTGLAGIGEIPITRTYPDQGHGRVAVTALPTGLTMFTVPELQEGRWLQDGETDAIVLSKIARDDNVPDARVGDTVQLSIGGKATTWNVVGIAEDGSRGVYTTSAGFAAASDQPQRVNVLRIATQDHDKRARAAAAATIEETLVEAGIGVKSAASVARANAASEGHIGPLATILLVIAIAMGIVGGIGLASTMSANVLDRVREFGVMHAIGAKPKVVRRIVVTEGMFLGLASCVVAILPALGLTAILGAGLGNLFMDAPLPYRISLLAVGIWLVVALLGAALATEAAATRASRIIVREALAYV